MTSLELGAISWKGYMESAPPSGYTSDFGVAFARFAQG
jgi:hypothetical protein